jgi:PBSX family phage terminase large subunit
MTTATADISELATAHRWYQAHGAALALWRDTSPEVVLSGPAGTGKSRACLEKLHACCLRWPGTRALIVRKTRESLTESALVTFESNVLPAGDPLLVGPQRRMRQAYHYPNGSEVVVGGLDKPSKVMSTEYDLIYVQEAIELYEDDWESLTTRLRHGVMPFQQLVGDTNPDAPTHWLRRRADAGRTVMYESRHEDNPVIWDADNGAWTAVGAAYIAKLEALTGVRFHRLRHGRWVGSEGMVYGDWDRSLHLIDRFGIPASWRRIRSVDFGYTNPFCCQWWAIDGDGRMYLYREIYRTKRTVADHAVPIGARSAGERIEATVSDHDAEDRATLHQCGIQTLAAHKAITPGIQAVEERLRVAGDGRPRLFVFRDALVDRDEGLAEAKLPTSTAEEFDAYVWPKGQDGKALKEIPVDANNHGMDAMRYAVAYVDNLGLPRPGPAAVAGSRPSLGAPPTRAVPVHGYGYGRGVR